MNVRSYAGEVFGEVETLTKCLDFGLGCHVCLLDARELLAGPYAL